jgi:hypothetical protein
VSTTVPADLPRLVAAPGMTLREVIASSTAALSTYENEGRGLAQPDGPHHLVLHALGGDLELPAGLFSLLQTSGPLVYRLRVTPHIDHLDHDGALAFADVLIQSLLAAGWKGAASIDAKVVDEVLAIADRISAGPWQLRTWTAEIEIRRIVRGGTELAEVLELPGDGFLATLLIWDEHLAAAAGEIRRGTH